MNLTRREFVVGGSAAVLSTLPILQGCTAGQVRLQSPFDISSTAEEVTAGLDLSGKTALITGCNSGIGLETMRVLALRGAHVLGLARTMEKAQEACASVTGAAIKGRATPFACEQTDFGSVAACAEAIVALDIPIDMLICNAGVFLQQLEQVNGIEKTFVINHLSHFLLVNRLLNQVRAAPQGRIVMVGSQGYRLAPKAGIEFDNLSGERDFSGAKWYGQSKLANGLFARELARRLTGTAVTANVLDPGTVGTNIFRHFDKSSTPPWHQRAYYRLWSLKEWLVHPRHMRQLAYKKTLAQGAATTCFVATYPALEKVSGAYFVDCAIETPGGHMRDDAMAAKLWTVSAELTRDYLQPQRVKS